MFKQDFFQQSDLQFLSMGAKWRPISRSATISLKREFDKPTCNPQNKFCNATLKKTW